MWDTAPGVAHLGQRPRKTILLSSWVPLAFSQPAVVAHRLAAPEKNPGNKPAASPLWSPVSRYSQRDAPWRHATTGRRKCSSNLDLSVEPAGVNFWPNSPPRDGGVWMKAADNLLT